MQGVVRAFPYPYRAMLAICSDLDETPDRHVYLETMRYLNTTQTTSMGQGVGLEVGNSIYFDMPPDQFAYWNTDDTGREMVRNLIKSGHIDCFHSFGDLATTRRHAEIALEEMNRHDCRMQVWIDHGTAPTNLGSDIMQGHGDEPGSSVFHADLTCQHGVEYVWRGRVTSVIGQDVRRRLGGVWNRHHPLASASTLAREFAKGMLAHAPDGKYRMHASNRLLREVRLRSGHVVQEFLRSNPHWGGVSSHETADGLADVLSEQMLSRLVEREGVCVLYTHLGKIRRRHEPFGPDTREALARLARHSRQGSILVTTTRRALGYCKMRRDVDVTLLRDGDSWKVSVTTRASAGDLDGLTVLVPDPPRTRMEVNGCAVTPVAHTLSGGSGCVSLPWRRLEFPEL